MTAETNTNSPEASPPPVRVRRSFGARALIAAAIGGAIASAGIFTLIERTESTTENTPPMIAAAKSGERWQCPMHPSIVRDHPGECPICGMHLVEMESSDAEHGSDEHDPHEAGGELATVNIDPARQQLIGLETAEASKGPVGAAWRTTGRVAIDETRVRHVNIKVSGFVEQIFVDFIGKPVKKGDPLFRIYSPELYAAQEEYLLALRTRNALAEGGALARSGDELLISARRKLELWDIPRADLDRLEKTGSTSKTLTLYAPMSGVVVKKDVVDGMRLEAGAMPYEIVDLSKVWVLADVYESELRHIAPGLSARMEMKAFPNREFSGRVAFIAPLLDPATRTVKVRLEFPNPTGELRPEMFGEVTFATPAREGLRIPSDALIESGQRSVVFVALGQGKFQPREVKVGESDDQHTEIVDGLSEGERVVTRANFLIDSESRLRASLTRMSQPSGHEGHNR